MEDASHRGLLVKHALSVMPYRVYPDTPLEEVLDLMVRREVRAVPVVGEQYEVLGVITSGDALEQLLRGGAGESVKQVRGEPATGSLLARDVMTRTVLCVSDDQPLMEAANMMVHREAEQLPVVRDGAFIGFLTRDTVLRALHEGALDPRDEPEEPS